MNALAIFLYALVAICGVQTSFASKSPQTNGEVVDLDARSFDSSIRDGNAWLIEFYAPWCGHCTRFAPTYEAVAKQLHENQSTSERKVMVAKVDGGGDRALASRFNVRGFPTFYLIDGWTVREYTGKRTQDALFQFATKTYEEYEPIPFLNSPFGPMGQSRALLMRVGTKTIDYHASMVKRGYPSIFAAITLAAFGIVFGLTAILVIGFMTLPKPKED
eukprot:CAMPEP_0197827348 /NCGR_PEP_ID=MMETSP1437-20131217/4142_1 /TAXON_ID=49252 ORGANISM="Eucampia antarctica, Strain CCMP1452" /NCGR_SAMPLE_ID=MMETSP1437 /ASSEMBLY_ACC=CAM_ASM_001096 /LENGTH=217 /DNA_ID=CAMNT_0043428153 /DNA_START=96 /DNA_END=749 /DNA_ORIENTATION=+